MEFSTRVRNSTQSRSRKLLRKVVLKFSIKSNFHLKYREKNRTYHAIVDVMQNYVCVVFVLKCGMSENLSTKLF